MIVIIRRRVLPDLRLAGYPCRQAPVRQHQVGQVRRVTEALALAREARTLGGLAQSMLLQNVTCDREEVRLGIADALLLSDAQQSKKDLLGRSAPQPPPVLNGQGGNEACLFRQGGVPRNGYRITIERLSAESGGAFLSSPPSSWETRAALGTYSFSTLGSGGLRPGKHPHLFGLPRTLGRHVASGSAPRLSMVEPHGFLPGVAL
jgi:hypothetical protein